jgi:hypothetical protein
MGSQSLGAKDWGGGAALKPALALALLFLAATLFFYIVKRSPERPPVIGLEHTTPGDEGNKNERVTDGKEKPAQPPSNKESIASDKAARDSSNKRRSAGPPLLAQVVTTDLRFVRDFDRAASTDRATRELKLPPGSLPEVKRLYIQNLSKDSSSGHVGDILAEQLRLSESLTVSNDRQQADAALRFVAARSPNSMSITVQLVDKNLNVIWPTAPGVRGRKYTGELQKAAAKIVEDLSEEFQKIKRQ